MSLKKIMSLQTTINKQILTLCKIESLINTGTVNTDDIVRLMVQVNEVNAKLCVNKSKLNYLTQCIK